jgi:hypothetical protein
VAAVAAVERIPEHPQQVSEIVIRAQEPRLVEDVRVRLLNQVLRVMVGTGEAERRPVEAVQVVREPLGIEPAPGGGGWLWVSRGVDGATLDQ